MGLFSGLTTNRLAAGARNALPILKNIRTVSFAQYAEDLIIYHMHPLDKGFYVDLGAFHPRTHSNTFKLYLRGWHGITIEPNPDAAAAFRAIRPRDRHLTLGIAGERSELTYYRFKKSELNTFDPGLAAGRGDEGPMGQAVVGCLTLNDVFDTYCAEQTVDLLSIDCEGRDLEIVGSLDWQRHRPTLVIVEDFEQFGAGASAGVCSAIRSHLLAQDYALASQVMFSSFYVDRHAFGRTRRDTGFRLDLSQLTLLSL